MAFTHIDKVKKMELQETAHIDPPSGIIERRKDANEKIVGIVGDILEAHPEIRFEQLMSCLIGGIDFYREPSTTLSIIESSMRTYGWKTDF